jgi:hypothetical protein
MTIHILSSDITGGIMNPASVSAFYTYGRDWSRNWPLGFELQHMCNFYMNCIQSIEVRSIMQTHVWLHQSRSGCNLQVGFG